MNQTLSVKRFEKVVRIKKEWKLDDVPQDEITIPVVRDRRKHFQSKGLYTAFIKVRSGNQSDRLSSEQQFKGRAVAHMKTKPDSRALAKLC